MASITVTQIGSHWKLTTTNVRRFAFTYDERQVGLRTWSVDKTGFVTPPVLGSPSYLNVGNLTWQLSDDLLWISRERSPSTYGPISQVFSEPFRIVIPSAPNANLTMYYEIAELISTSWYTYGKGSTQLIRDIDLYDGISAKYNLIVLGDPRYNYYTFKRTTSGSSKLFSFGDDGTMYIANKTYGNPGTGALFLAPSVARTRICLFVTGVDSEGLKRATWAIPYVVGMQVADYVVLGDSYGDPVWGWTATSGKRSEGAGGILATGFWSNEWDFDPLSGYLK